MLAKAHRLTSSELFQRAVRSGRKAGSPTVVLHLLADGAEDPDSGPYVGFVVSKAIGNAVTRNRVKRRLRHLARERVAALPGSCVLVVRALPASAGATFSELAADLDRCLERVSA